MVTIIINKALCFWTADKSCNTIKKNINIKFYDYKLSKGHIWHDTNLETHTNYYMLLHIGEKIWI